MLRISEFFDEPERRASPRYFLGGKATCRLTELSTGRHWPAAVHDISSGGVSLVAERDFAPDSLLSIELFTPSGTCLCTLRLRVVHSREREEGGWLMGCALASKLGDNELRGLVDNP